MAFYLHIGGEFSGRHESNILVDKWIHSMVLLKRLEIMEIVLCM